MTAMTTLVWVRLPNLPLHFYTLAFLLTLGNVLGKFIKIDTERITKGFVTFSRICVEIKLSQGLQDKILIDWDENDPYTQMVDYENTSFRCLSCQQTEHLHETCPLSPILASSLVAQKRAQGWKDPKNHKIRSSSSYDNTHHHKDTPTPLPSTAPVKSTKNAQKPTADPKHQPLASTQNPEASEILIPISVVQPLQPPPRKG